MSYKADETRLTWTTRDLDDHDNPDDLTQF